MGNSLDSKLDHFFKQKAGKTKIDKIRTDIAHGIKTSSNKSVHTPDEIAEKYIQVLKNTIHSSVSPEYGITSRIESAIAHDFSYNIIDKGSGRFLIEISFPDDLSRPSLNPKSNDLRNLAALYDNGVDHIMKQIIVRKPGGVVRRSRTQIEGAHFMEQAKLAFMANYGNVYNVLSVEIVGEDFNNNT